MKAAQINSYGASKVVEIADVHEPSLKDGQILVEVYAASLNPFDYKLREGYMQKMVSLSFPVTLGGDFSGIVKKIAENVTDFKIGDEVYGTANIANGGSGSLAEFAAANVKNTALKPRSTDWIGTASLPLVGASAIQGIEERIKIKKSQKILIQGGSGGIGSLVIQLAKMHGAYVATTVRKEYEGFVKNLGVDEVIDYKTQQFGQILKDYDAVFDTVGGEVTNKSFAVLKKGGILVSMVGQPDQDIAKQRGVTVLTQGTQTDTQKLNRLTQLVDGGKIKVQVDKVFPFIQVKEAFDYLEKSHPKGKVVVKINEN